MAKRTTRKPDDATHILDVAMRLIAERGWERLSMAEIADGAGLSMAVVYNHYRCKQALLDAFVRRVDEAVLADAMTDLAEEPPHDRLLELLMRRYEALSRNKAAIAAILRDTCRHPIAAMGSVPRLLTSMAWMLEAAGISTTGLVGLLRTKGLAAVYLATLRVWLADETGDMTRTMAALDRNLRRAEKLAGPLVQSR